MSGNHSQECQFFYKVGSCRHGPKCVRKHILPSRSTVIMLSNIPLQSSPGRNSIDQTIRDIFIEIGSIAPIEEVLVAANDSPHLKGAVYFSFSSAKDAEKVISDINSRWFQKRPVFAHYLPSQTVHMAVCREGDRCQRKLDCNYVHPMSINPNTWKSLFAAQAKEYAPSRGPTNVM